MLMYRVGTLVGWLVYVIEDDLYDIYYSSYMYWMIMYRVGTLVG